jgi:hypothetical protein
MSGTIEIGGKKYTVVLTEVKSTTTPEKSRNLSMRADPMGEVNQTGGKKAKKSKGTRKMNPYMNFAKKARQEVLAEYPELKSDVVAVGRKIGEKWRALSDAEKAKY